MKVGEDEDVVRIDIKEFREIGLVQEINRLLLHPLGLALEVVVDDDGTERLGGVWDYRDDPEGVHYGGTYLEGLKEKADRVGALILERTPERVKRLGYLIQPTEPPKEPT